MCIFIKFYTKPKCSLCDKARVLLKGLVNEYQLDIEEVNILDDPILYERYKYEIPVLISPGLFQVQGKIEIGRLREKLDLALLQSSRSG